MRLRSYSQAQRHCATQTQVGNPHRMLCLEAGRPYQRDTFLDQQAHDIVPDQPTISIVIKALNEEQRIAAAIESALAALAGHDGEVILADSASTDRTLEIARRYPIRIVTLQRIADRSCGAGAQLGYQYCRGRFICLIDGDMKLQPGFLGKALEQLARDPMLAGIGGLIRERETSNVEFEARERRIEPDRQPGAVSRLDCGGLYRREAIEAIGYFTDRNLHGGEELDLGCRLHAAGWTLARIDSVAIDHHGHSDGDFRLLARRFRNKTAFATGEAFRAAFGQPQFRLIFRNNNAFLLCAIIHLWWLSMLAALVAVPGWQKAVAFGVLLALPFGAMALKWRSWRYALYAVSAWNIYAVGFWFGLLRPRIRPQAWIDGHVVADAKPNSAAA
ncbi:glycosyltransferase [Methylobacterium planeticum]|uniref:glycosyltransferase n=1 Tax=Methylobacterium planeticum TaxID=2615211 RepID=UPI001786A3A8|nr:glycosyltransferase family 2 protein [Methylobacterium planeticum]